MKFEISGRKHKFHGEISGEILETMGCKDQNLLISEEIVKKTRVDKAQFWSHNFSNSKILYYLGFLLKI